MLALNDNGRVALGPSIGQAAESVEGTLQAHTDSAYLLRVTGVTYLNGQTNRWTSEPLNVPNQFVSVAQERRFSRSRTALATALAAGGVVLFALTRNLLGLGGPGRDPGPGEGGTGQ